MRNDRKNRILVLSAFMAAGLCFGASCTYEAQEIVLTGEPCPLTVLSELSVESTGEEAETISQQEMFDKIQVLGTVDEEYTAVLLDDVTIGYVSVEELQEKIPALDTTRLPAVSAWTDQSRGMAGEAIYKAQEAMVELGLIAGPADGNLGPNTENGIRTFQEENSLEANGVLNLLTYFLLQDAAAGKEMIETVYPPVYTVEEKFASIVSYVADKTALEQYLTPDWKFTYDVFGGKGYIYQADNVLAEYEDNSRPIDRISMVVDTVVYVLKENGLVDLYPAVRVQSQGAYRPYVRQLLLRAGNDVAEMPLLVSYGSVSGTTVMEESIVPLTEEAEQLLAGTDTAKDIILRVQGSGREYDLEL